MMEDLAAPHVSDRKIIMMDATPVFAGQALFQRPPHGVQSAGKNGEGRTLDRSEERCHEHHAQVVTGTNGRSMSDYTRQRR